MLLQCTRRVCPESRRFPHLLCYPLFRAISSFSSSHWALLLFTRRRQSDPFRVFTQSHHSAKPRQWLPSPSRTSLQWLEDCPGSAAPPHLSSLLSPLLPPHYLHWPPKLQAHRVLGISTYSFLSMGKPSSRKYA